MGQLSKARVKGNVQIQNLYCQGEEMVLSDTKCNYFEVSG